MPALALPASFAPLSGGCVKICRPSSLEPGSDSTSENRVAPSVGSARTRFAPAIVGIRCHPVRRMGHDRVHATLEIARIGELDQMPSRATTGEVDLAVEDLPAAIARDRDPGALPPVIGDLLVIAIADTVEVAAARRRRRSSRLMAPKRRAFVQR